jgi:hypothetical protein
MIDELDDLPTLADFRDQLVTLAQSKERSPAPGRVARGTRRRSRLTLVVGALGVSALAATAAAATFAGLRATVIPGPSPEDVAPEMTVRPGSTHVLGLRVRDPSDHTVWTLRRARNRAGELCLTVGQTRLGTFGLVGLDGRFRTLAPAFVDGCGTSQSDQAAILGARVFAAASRGGVRTAVYGQGGAGLRGVTVATSDGSKRTVAVADGAFLAVSTGYPEDRPLTVTLRFAGGRRQSQTFGASPRLVTDPAGGPALKLNGFMTDSDLHSHCLTVGAARDASGRAHGPAICGSDRPSRLFGAVRRVAPGRHGPAGAGGYDWGGFPARTLAWGASPPGGPRVRAVTATSGGRPFRGRVLGRSSFLVVLPGDVAPAGVRVRVVTADGRAVTFTKSLNLVPNPLTR